MTDKNVDIEKLLLHILENRASLFEIRYFSEWMKKVENKEYFEKYKKFWNLSAGGHATQEMVENGLNDYVLFMKKSLKLKQRKKWMLWITSAAASCVIFFFSVLWLQKEEIHQIEKYEDCSRMRGVILKLADSKEIVINDSLGLIGESGQLLHVNKIDQRQLVYKKNDSLDVLEDDKIEYNQIIVPAGERFFVQLSDGTKVWINSESSLRYPAYFGKNVREVEARGNVYFEVVKDSVRPFVVIARELTTEVLGTRFEVNTYGDQDEVSTTLVEGKVRVNAGNRQVIMKPNQQFTFNTKSGNVALVEVDAVKKVMWKDGILVIDNESFRNVIWKLERWYGVSIVNETGLVFTQSFSGEFDRENIQAAIETICVNLNIAYVMDKDRIILKR
mgnify:CR=1 FL=1